MNTDKVKLFLVSALSVILVFCNIFICISGCYGKKGSNSNDLLPDIISPTEQDSEINFSFTDLLSDSDTTSDSDMIISETDIISESDSVVSNSDIASATDVLSRDERDAPGVFGATYENKYYIVIYLETQSVCVYAKDSDGFYNKLTKRFTCSTGRKGHESPIGLFAINLKCRWRSLNGNVMGQYSCRFADGYWFHSVPYYKQRPDTLNTSAYDKLGTKQSGGCIRLCTRDAKWIYDNCKNGTQVYIIDASGPKGAGVPRRNSAPEYAGWDPSDKWSEGNPYFTTATSSSTTPSASSTESATSAATTSAATTSTAATSTAASTSASTTTTGTSS